MVLRAAGVLCYSASLAADVDAQRELPAGSEQEVEIRAATVVAVERMRRALAGAPGGGGRAPAAIQLDYWLWSVGEGERDAPTSSHHRTRTIYY